MKLSLLRILALSVFCWLAPSAARAEEVTVSLGMSFDQVIEAMQKCGGKDIAQPLEAPGRTWWLEAYHVRVVLGEHYGKLSDLKYLPDDVIRKDNADPAAMGQPAQSLKFDTVAQNYRAEGLPSLDPLPLVRSGKWLVRVELLVATLPQEKALALLPDLRDENKVEAAYTQIMADIQRKEARLIGYPVVYSPAGEKATVETIFEKIYPSQYDPPQVPQTVGAAVPPPEASRTDAVPTAFEKRNVGVTMEVEATVEDGGEWINLIIQPQHVEYDGMDSYEFRKVPSILGKVEQPRFYAYKESFSMPFHNGQRVLVGVHKSLRTDEMELHLVQVTAKPIPSGEGGR